MKIELAMPSLQDLILKESQPYLDNFKQKGELEEKERQKIMAGIWQLSSLFYPSVRAGETTLSVPSARLVELGLVSAKAAEEIDERRIRKANGFDQIRPEDEPLNIITIERTKTGFQITKSYVAEEQYLETGEIELRKDVVMEEKALLIKEGDGYALNMALKEGRTHLHALGRVWFVQESSPEEARYQEVAVTAKDLVRTLVLLIEGVFPGSLVA